MGIVINQKHTESIFQVFCKIEVNRDVTFDEDVSFNKYRKTHLDGDKQETSKVVGPLNHQLEMKKIVYQKFRTW